MNTLRIFLFLAAACVAKNAPAADENAGIVYGHNHAVSVAAPPGWVLDNKSGVVNGVYDALYPAGGSWANSPAVMYANCSDKTPQTGLTLEDFIKTDAEVFKKPDPDIIIKKLPEEFHAGKTSSGMYFNSKANKEAVVYVDEDKVVCMMVLSSKSDEDYTASLAAYKIFLNSYKFIGGNVELPKDSGQSEPKSDATPKDGAEPRNDAEPKGGVE